MKTYWKQKSLKQLRVLVTQKIIKIVVLISTIATVIHLYYTIFIVREVIDTFSDVSKP